LLSLLPAGPAASYFRNVTNPLAVPRRAAVAALVLLAVAGVRPASAQKLEALWYLRGEGSIQAFLEHADQISIVSPQVFSLDGNGVIRGRVDPRVVAKAREKHVQLVPLVMNPGFDQPAIHRVLTVPVAWNAAIRNLAALCRDNHFDGIQFDIENVHVNDKDAFTKFVRESTDSLHRAGCTVSAAVVPRLNDDPGGNNYHQWIYQNWRAVYDYKALADTMDFLSYMTYAQHTGGSTPGPVAGYQWMESCLQFLLSLGVPPAKISLGLASYSDWWYPVYDTTKKMSLTRGSDIAHKRAVDLAAKAGVTPTWDDKQKAYYAMWENHGVFEHLWIEDSRSFMDKLALVRTYNLRGYSVWVLGTEDPAIWELLKTEDRRGK
jgi:spore germination protein YaaH